MSWIFLIHITLNITVDEIDSRYCVLNDKNEFNEFLGGEEYFNCFCAILLCQEMSAIVY